MKMKKLLLLPLVGTAALALASCSTKTDRNTSTPTGSLDLNAVVAKSNSSYDLNNLTTGFYYNKLRTNGYSIVTNNLKELYYAKELSAIKELIASNGDYSKMSADALTALCLKENADDQDTKVSEELFNKFYTDYSESLSNTLASSIFSSTSAETIKAYDDEDKLTYIYKFVQSCQRQGYENCIDLCKDTDGNLDKTKFDNLISYGDFDKVKINFKAVNEAYIESNLLSLAEDLYARKQLYIIADQEILYEDTDDEVKNTYNYFTDEKFESAYNSTYKTYGEYRAIVIQFNTAREAKNAMQAIVGSTKITFTDTTEVLNTFVKLYNYYYKYKDQAVDSNDSRFTYTINKDKNELSSTISNSSVTSLITDTLEDNEFTVEPRNIGGKYALVYRISATYEVSGTDEEAEWDDLDDTKKDSYIELLKYDLVKNNASSYKSTAFTNILKEDEELKIYDPYFEYKFYASYDDYYDVIKKDDFVDNLIFKSSYGEYTVTDFYSEASKMYASTIIPEYFQLEFANKFVGVDGYIDEDTVKSNTDTLNDAISTFNKGKNSTYDKALGEELFLMLSYGYSTKDDVLKYYYNAKSALTSYKSKVLFNEWATEDHKISDSATSTLTNILNTGNESYESLFSINLDRILINIDDDGDGSPDDPDKFLSKNEDKKDAFEAAVVKLAQAIYKEATNEIYKDLSLYEVLSYIKNQYYEGGTLCDGTSWDDYKEFNFLLTVEQLASSGDITQSSVSNFVEPFANYVKGVVKTAGTCDYDNGKFYVYDTKTEEGKVIDEAADSTSITVDTLCKTVYGYHLLVLNSSETTGTLRYTSDDDANGYQSALEILISEEDTDDDDDNIYVVTNSYNENASEASLNQLFIYYVQTKTSADSSLDSDIVDVLSNLFDDSISMYSNSGFQTLLLIDLLDIEVLDTTISNSITYERQYYVDQITSYDSESKFTSWTVDTVTKWVRPDRPTSK